MGKATAEKGEVEAETQVLAAVGGDGWMRRQVIASWGIVICYVVFMVFVASLVRIPVTYRSVSQLSPTSLADNGLIVTEEVEVVVTRGLWSFLRTLGVESWMVHTAFLTLLFSVNLLWFYFTRNRTKSR